MGLNKYKLGELIEICCNTNYDLQYGIERVRGVNNQKQLMDTKADLNGRDLSKFQIVKAGEFVFNHRTSRNGSKFSIALNNDKAPVICTEDYVVFRISDRGSALLDKIWLYMFFNRPEFDRFVITNSWGSSTEFYNWEDLCDVDILLPPLEIQQKYVDIFNAMLANQQNYERGLDELKLVCDAYVEDLRRNTSTEPIGKHIEKRKQKNTNESIKDVYGVSTTQQFVTASSSVDKENLSGYKVVSFEDIAYVPTTHMKVFAIAISDSVIPFVVSPIYEVFSVRDKNILDPRYLFMWLCRDESIRYAFYNSWGSARENFVFDDLCTIQIPIPDINIQHSIVNIYDVCQERKKIGMNLSQRIKDICPILIKGSIIEAQETD